MAITVRQWASLAILIALAMILPGGLLPLSASATPLPSTGVQSATPSFETSQLSAGSLPAFPSNLTHFVYIVRENHDFDDYLGDCSLNINDTCNGGKAYSSTSSGTASETSPSGNQINGPNLHALAREYAVFDNMYSSVDAYSAQGHNYLFSANVWGGSDSCGNTVEGTGSSTQWGIYNNSNVKAGSCGWSPDLGSQTYSSSGGSIFDRFLGPNVPQSKTTIPFLADGDNVWELSSPGCTVTASKTIPGDSLNSVQVVTGCTNGYWMNTTSGSPSMPPTINPVTGIPQFLWECQFASGCGSTAPSTFLDSYAANSFTSFLSDYGLPTYTEVELQDDHPGSYCGQTDSICVQWNDAAVNQVVSAIENSTTLSKNTVIAITEDDTQNGANGMDHVNSGRRLPFVVVAPHTVMKSGGAPSTCGISSSYTSCGLVIHQTFNSSNVLAVMERVEMNVNPTVFVTGGISPNNNAFPMIENDYLAEGNPLEPLWKCGQPSVPCNTGTPAGLAINSFTAAPSTIPLGGTVYLNATATGGTSPYAYVYTGLPSGCTTSSTPTYTCVPTASGSFTATVTVTDSASNTATGTASFTVTSASGLAIVSFTALPTSIPLGGTAYLNVTATGGTSPYTYAYTSLPAGCASSNTNRLICAPTVSGSFSVGVTVTDSASNTVSGTAPTFTVVAPSALAISAFTASPATVPPGGTTYLNVTASGGSPAYSYVYTGLPGGCSTSNTANLVCAPTVSTGTFTISVTVTDSRSTTAFKTTALTIFGASATESVSRGTAPLSVSFTATASGGASPYSYLWAFGDSNGSTLASPAYTYARAGTFDPMVTVTDSQGHRATVALPAITVTGGSSGPNAITVTITANPLNGAVPLAVTFQAGASGGSGGYTSYAWSFGDNDMGAGNPISHTYGGAGTFPVEVTVTDASGTTGHGFTNVTVSQAPPGPASSSIPWIEYAAVGAVVVIAVALVAVFAGRKKRPGYESPP